MRRAQSELAHASRVATLGELSASIAHDVNQPLSAIITNAQACLGFLRSSSPDLDEVRDAIEWIVKDGNRAGEVIGRIRELSRKAEPEVSQIDINGLVEETAALVRGEAFGHKVVVQPELASGLPRIRGDKIQLQQVLINLVMNGIQAMASVADRARVLILRTQRHGDDQILVAVEDVGVGIEPENLGRLFNAFYTTKASGLGIGLSISRSIVEAHGGRVWAAPNAGPGMTFQFTLSADLGKTAAASPD